MSVRRWDQSYAAVYVPGDEDSVGPWQGGGFIAMTWHKARGGTDLIVRIESNGASLLTLEEAEAAVASLSGADA